MFVSGGRSEVDFFDAARRAVVVGGHAVGAVLVGAQCREGVRVVGQRRRAVVGVR